MAAAAFWIFLAAIIVAAEWRKKHSEAMRHETVRLIIEKNQKLDEDQIKELLSPYPNPLPIYSAIQSHHRPGDVYKGLRVFGTIIMFVALGLMTAAIWVGSVRGINDDTVVGLGIAVPIVALVGAGFFFASRFAAKPPSDEIKD